MSRANKIFLYLFYFAIVAVLSGFIITSSKSKHPAVPKASVPAQHKQQTATTKPPAPAAPTKPAPKTTHSSTSQTPTPANHQQTPSPASSQSSLADTGPGDVIGLFVIAGIAGAALHRRILINRAG
jgi:carbohydrate-binding DOMON domain-containing protein